MKYIGGSIYIADFSNTDSGPVAVINEPANHDDICRLIYETTRKLNESDVDPTGGANYGLSKDEPFMFNYDTGAKVNFGAGRGKYHPVCPGCFNNNVKAPLTINNNHLQHFPSTVNGSPYHLQCSHLSLSDRVQATAAEFAIYGPETPLVMQRTKEIADKQNKKIEIEVFESAFLAGKKRSKRLDWTIDDHYFDYRSNTIYNTIRGEYANTHLPTLSSMAIEHEQSVNGKSRGIQLYPHGWLNTTVTIFYDPNDPQTAYDHAFQQEKMSTYDFLCSKDKTNQRMMDANPDGIRMVLCRPSIIKLMSLPGSERLIKESMHLGRGIFPINFNGITDFGNIESKLIEDVAKSFPDSEKTPLITIFDALSYTKPDLQAIRNAITAFDREMAANGLGILKPKGLRDRLYKK